ncbi:MAG: hypothetical protein E6J42_01995 [Chloroflexi bacterium]|nr:MAG: hypothetical protein E6J42_01995 [Chloroflexota bacterium]
MRAEAELVAVDEAVQIIADLGAAVARGEEHWFFCMLTAVRRWPLPAEQVNGRTFRYLVGGEAFDWLLLAERLCEELTELVPADEVEGLLFHGRLPVEMRGDELQRLLGAKYRSHLNFVYGVHVEEALQLAVQGEVHKERTSSRIWENGHMDDEVFSRVYGASKPALFSQFREAQALPQPEAISLADLREFTYWLFKYRLKNCDPARVASDTRKGLAQLQRLEAMKTRAVFSSADNA